MSIYRWRFDVLKTRKKVQYRFIILRGEQCARAVFIIWAQDGQGKYARKNGHTVLKQIEKKNTIDRTNIIVRMSLRNAFVRRVWSRTWRIADDRCARGAWQGISVARPCGGRGTKRDVYRNLAANFFVRRWSSDIMRFFFLTRALHDVFSTAVCGHNCFSGAYKHTLNDESRTCVQNTRQL